MGGPFSLEMIDVASPCDVPWDSMTGDERVRFCGECQLHVYHLSAMTREEAEALINEKEGRLCVQFYRRADGTVLTRDCPVGVETLRRRAVRGVLAAVGAVCGLIAGLFVTPAVLGPNRGSAKLRQCPSGRGGSSHSWSAMVTPCRRIAACTSAAGNSQQVSALRASSRSESTG